MKTVILYITLVGILFIGLLAVLKIGEKLNAPENVSGDWQISGKFADSVQNSCTPIFLPLKNPAVFIEQSGIHLTITFNDRAKTEMHGELENNKVIFEQTLHVKSELQNVYGKKTLAKLALEFHKKKDKLDQLLGAWANPMCNSCGQIQFSAIKKQD